MNRIAAEVSEDRLTPPAGHKRGMSGGHALPPILFLGDHFGYAGGVAHGSTMYNLHVLPALVEAGVEIVPCFLRDPHPSADILREAGIDTIFLAAHRLSPFVIPRVAAIARANRCGIIHSAGIKATLVGRMVAPWVGAKSLIHVHDQFYPGKAMTGLHRLFARASDSAMCVSRSVREVAVEGYHVRTERAYPLHNGLPLDRIKQVAPDARCSMRRELGILDTTPVLSVIGRIHPVKGQMRMLSTMTLILREMPDAVLLLIGDGPARADCEQKAHELGISQQVRFLGHRADVPELLAATDILVVPSSMEGLPYSAIEALAAGRPVVAYRVGGLPEVVTSGTDGILVEPDDDEAFAEAVLALLANERMRAEYGEAGKISAERFGLVNHVEELIALYENIAFDSDPL